MSGTTPGIDENVRGSHHASSLPDRAIELGLGAALAVTPCLVSTQMHDVFTRPKTLFVELIAVATLLAAATRLAGRGSVRIPCLGAPLAVILLALLMTASVAWAADARVALGDLGFHLAVMVIGAMTLLHVSDRERARRLVLAAIAGGVLVALFATVQCHQLDAPLLGALSDALYRAPSVVAPGSPGGVATGLLPALLGAGLAGQVHAWIDPRSLLLPPVPGAPSKIYSFLGNSNHVACHLAVLWPLAAALALAGVGSVLGRPMPRGGRGSGARLLSLTLAPSLAVLLLGTAPWSAAALAGLLTAVVGFLLSPRVRSVAGPGLVLWLLTSTIVLTGCRHAWVSLAVGSACLATWVWRGGGRQGCGAQWLRPSLGVVMVTALLAALSAGWGSVRVGGLVLENPLSRPSFSIPERLTEGFTHGSSASLRQRWLIDRTALEILGDGPARLLFGTGTGTFGLHYQPYQGRVLASPGNRHLVPVANRSIHAHCEPLEFASELGLVGLGLFLLAGLSLARALRPHLGTGPLDGDGLLFVGLVSSLVVVSVETLFGAYLHLAPTAVLCVVIAALALRFNPCPTRRVTIGPWLRLLAPVLAVVAAGFVVGRARSEIAGQRAWRDGCHAFRLERFEEAIETLDRALELSDERGQILFDKGRALLDSGRNREAILVFNRAGESFVDSATHVNLGICHLKESQAALKEGRVADERRERARAIEEFRRALALDPTAPSALRNLSRTLRAAAGPGRGRS